MVDSEHFCVFKKGAKNKSKKTLDSLGQLPSRILIGNNKKKIFFMENTSFTSLDALIIFKCSNCEQKHQRTLGIHDTCQGTYKMDYIMYQQLTWKFGTVEKKQKQNTHMNTHILHHPQLQI